MHRLTHVIALLPLSFSSDTILNRVQVLKRLMRHEFVDPKKSTLYLHVPACSVLPSADSYLDIIENPMDLGSIQKALEQGQIRDAQSFVDLILLVFNNAIKFNMDSDIPNTMHVSSTSIPCSA